MFLITDGKYRNRHLLKIVPNQKIKFICNQRQFLFKSNLHSGLSLTAKSYKYESNLGLEREKNVNKKAFRRF